METEEAFIKLKSEYDISYKKYNVEQINKINKAIIVFIILIVFFILMGSFMI